MSGRAGDRLRAPRAQTSGGAIRAATLHLGGGAFTLVVAVLVYHTVLWLGHSPAPLVAAPVSQSSLLSSPVPSVHHPDYTEGSMLERARREIEDEALDKLRVKLIENHAEAKEDTAKEDKDDEEMQMIFEIVRLAQERYGSEADASLDADNRTFLDRKGHVLPTLRGAACVQPDDCKKTCEDQCLALAPTQFCNEGCRRPCEKHCSKQGREGDAQCQEQCAGQCKEKCAASNRDKLFRRRDKCQAACQSQCATAGGGVTNHCYRDCVDANATAACTAAMYPSCFEGCGRHVCVEARCRCPIYSDGNPLDCAATLEHEKFAPRHQNPNTTWSYLDKGHPLTQTNLMEAYKKFGHTSRSGQPDLDSMADFSTCAVVGSSDAMLGKGKGREIDEHTAVIRFNDAPTRGHHEDVGNKTTLRVQNVMTCGFHEGLEEICLHYTGWAGNTCERETLDWWNECKYVRPSDRMFNYVRNLFGDPHASFTRGNAGAMKTLQRGRHKAASRDTSAGFFGVGLALHLCGKVDLYGFTQSAGHYYNKIDRSRGLRRFAAKHSWALEKQCLEVVGSLQRVAQRS